MDTLMKFRRLATIGALGGIAALSIGAAHAQKATIVKIGHVAPLSGPNAEYGKDTENGARMAVEEINKRGLVVGGEKVTLELDSQDDAGDPKTATQVAQKLVDDGVVAVVGHMNSGTSIPASKIYSDAGIVQVSPSATNPAYTLNGYKTAYRVVATDAQQGPVLAEYAAKNLHAKTVAIVDDATAYGQGLADQFESRVKSLGLTVLSHEKTTDKAVDFRAILTKIKSERPDVIMYGGMDATGGPFTKQARELAIKARVLGGDGLCADSLEKLAGEAAGNVVCSIAGGALERQPNGPDFAARFKQRFGQNVQVNAPFAYDAVYVIADAMQRAKSPKAADILAAMPRTDYTGVLGRIRFDSRGDLKDGAISLYRYANGKRTLIDQCTAGHPCGGDAGKAM
jgi:branched-chain amino acid transport system substrate-binding protein